MPKRRDITAAEIELSLKLGARLRGLRCECGLTQEEVAARAGIATFTYQKFEKGESRPGTPMNPELYTLQDLSRALGVELSVLLDFS